MKKYVKIQWQGDEGDLPRIMELDNTIEITELKEIIEAKAKNRVLQISEYTPEPLYLILYVGMREKRKGYTNTLFLHLSPTCSEKYEESLAMIKNFGKFTECEHIYDIIRCTLHDYIVSEEDNTTMYFEEFVIDCRGQFISILQALVGIFQCFDSSISNKDYKNAMFQRLTETWEN